MLLQGWRAIMIAAAIRSGRALQYAGQRWGAYSPEMDVTGDSVRLSRERSGLHIPMAP